MLDPRNGPARAEIRRDFNDTPLPLPIAHAPHPSTVTGMETPRSFADLAAPAALAALRDPEKITLAGDFHCEHPWARHVIKAARRAGSEVVVQVGDFGVWPDRAGNHFLNEVNRWAEHTGLPVLFVDGNHENFLHLASFPVDPNSGLRALRPWVFHAPRGTRWTWRSLTWLALGGATSLDRAVLTPWVDWFPQEALTVGDTYRAAAGGDVDVMITHDCPAGVAIPDLRRSAWSTEALTDARVHREMLRNVVDVVRPTHLFHGHFHRRYTAPLDLGEGLVCEVTGLDMNGTGAKGYLHVDLDILVAQSWAARAG